ncbi:carboxymuconolactone decarboxylase family protein [Draconibacterium sp. IB214405]|uniref:carboxymuconolactone decarboxylase family protein n=1 Tax=Draconibacterium sp. IB214405 TaxID=3097352 RepID=UPI002A154F24|nr:carboxymuconolactone decarboxylase family protein [Draconibacterium sp. IB214405]MDX8341252.1 carboxymuconolactone decarboxylase family protein [Draconibacterium sp. IB214405]
MKQPLVAPKKGASDPELQQLIEFYEETLGFCPNSVKTMHHRPQIAYAFIEMNKAVMENKGRVTSALKRMIAYISSNAAGCRYCQAHAIRAAERYGAEQEQLDNIWEYKTHPAFSEAERAVLDFAYAASIIPNSVDDQIADNLRTYWDEGEIVEITGVVALFGYLNRWNDSMGTEIENGAIESGEKLLGAKGWNTGKHSY